LPVVRKKSVRAGKMLETLSLVSFGFYLLIATILVQAGSDYPNFWSRSLLYQPGFVEC